MIIKKQITHGSEGDGTDYQPLANASVDIIFLGLIICTASSLPCVIYIITTPLTHIKITPALVKGFSIGNFQ